MRIQLFSKTKRVLPFDIGWATDRGRKRIDSPNQDALIVLTSTGRRNAPALMVIADGMGGYLGGAMASEIIIQSVQDTYKTWKSPYRFEEFSQTILEKSHHRMLEKAQADDRFENMGSTIVAASVEKSALHLMNVGDSRAYRVHNGEMIQVNYDHSFVGEAIRAGFITPAEAMTHPRRNQLTQSVSARRGEIKPYFCDIPFEADDVLVLCSDGLWGVVSEEMIQAVVTELPSQAAVERLIMLANARGGPDNISVIVCKRNGAQPQLPAVDQE